MSELIPAPDDELCLAYANTRSWRGSDAPTETLHAIADVLRWAETQQKLPSPLVRRCAARWRETPGTIFDEAIGLRETIVRCFGATAAHRQPAESDTQRLQVALEGAPPRHRMRSAGWDVGQPEPTVEALLAPTLWSAADLLLGSQLARVRQCANPQCGWLFLDNSKSGNRRWCSMSSCGNRAKAQRHYLRQKEP